jgi:hypothetical protein
MCFNSPAGSPKSRIGNDGVQWRRRLQTSSGLQFRQRMNVALNAFFAPQPGNFQIVI